ncbi:MAG TPA: xanthine dehydrogenase family protein subunit M [Vicinamibacterales bacterium]|nr:xanthine dehydrogenase family protein subunit M [Vicinamibacterales bacterium]
MKPAAFEYHRPDTRPEALALLEQHGGDAKPLAGGQSLIPAMNFRLATPAVLVDLNRVGDLAYMRVDSGVLRIGAMTRHRDVERSEDVRRAAPLLFEAMPFIAHAAIRTRGTIGGSLAHADPAAELPAVMLALDATFRVESVRGAREIRATDFFTGLFGTALEPGELVTEIQIPVTPATGPRTGTAFTEFSRRHGDFALAGVAARVTTDERGTCVSARIALFGVGDRPMAAAAGARLLEGQTVSDDLLRATADATAREDIDPTGDIHASSRYRRHLAGVLTRRVVARAFERSRVTHEE